MKRKQRVPVQVGQIYRHLEMQKRFDRHVLLRVVSLDDQFAYCLGFGDGVRPHQLNTRISIKQLQRPVLFELLDASTATHAL